MSVTSALKNNFLEEKFPEADPHGIASGEPGAKLDAGKVPVTRGAIQYFPRAIRAIAALSGKGAEKYSWNGLGGCT